LKNKDILEFSIRGTSLEDIYTREAFTNNFRNWGTTHGNIKEHERVDQSNDDPEFDDEY
jgi:hypothetical protein